MNIISKLFKRDQTIKLKGDLNINADTSKSDLSLQEIAKSASDLGYKYIAITDTANNFQKRDKINEEKLQTHKDMIDCMRNIFPDLTILRSLDCPVNQEGDLPFADEILQNFDLIIASLQPPFENDQTARILKIFNNKFVNMLGFEGDIADIEEIIIDKKRILKEAVKNEIALEIKPDPMNSIALKILSENNNCRYLLQCVINSGAHSIEELQNIQNAIQSATQIKLQPPQILNTHNIKIIRRFIEEKKQKLKK